MSELLLIRHAETDMAGRFCGHADPPVNSRGLAQLRDLQERLRDQKPAALYASDLQRAQTTARALADLFSVPVVLSPALREICFGDWEGLSWPQIEAQDATYAASWLSAFPHRPAPHGEGFAAFELRVLAAIRSILAQHDGERAMVVTHAGVMRVVLRTLCGRSESEAWAQTRDYCCTYLYCSNTQPGQAGQEICA